MEPEENDPTLLVGCHVVETGRRQAWPFINLAHPSTGREVRLYIDAGFSVVPGWTGLTQDDGRALLALDALTGQSVARAFVSPDGLRLELTSSSLSVAAAGNHLTTQAPWWFGAQPGV